MLAAQATCQGAVWLNEPPSCNSPPNPAANITGSNDAKKTTFQAALGGGY